MTRMVVLVNGLPAAGKSTLAPDLAAELGLPLFTMDVIKEAHADVLGAHPPNGLTQREWNRQLGKAATATMWALLNQSTPGAVLESSWRSDVRHLVEAGLRSVGLSTVAEVWCEAPTHVLRERFTRRWHLSHPIHGAAPDDQEWAQKLEHGEPLALGPVLRVDTTTQADITALAAWCRSNARTTEK
jgi:predicted kinase